MTCILGCKYILVLNILISHLRKFISLRIKLLGKQGVESQGIMWGCSCNEHVAIRCSEDFQGPLMIKISVIKGEVCFVETDPGNTSSLALSFLHLMCHENLFRTKY